MTNPTTPFSWQMPTSTDLVTDLPADFETFGQAVATSMERSFQRIYLVGRVANAGLGNCHNYHLTRRKHDESNNTVFMANANVNGFGH